MAQHRLPGGEIRFFESERSEEELATRGINLKPLSVLKSDTSPYLEAALPAEFHWLPLPVEARHARTYDIELHLELSASSRTHMAMHALRMAHCANQTVSSLAQSHPGRGSDIANTHLERSLPRRAGILQVVLSGRENGIDIGEDEYRARVHGGKLGDVTVREKGG